MLRCRRPRLVAPLLLVSLLALVSLVIIGPAVGADAPAKPAASFSDGQKVEVREGDTWSAGTVVRREGRKYLVHYAGADAASDEWVTADRVRTAGAEAAVPAGRAPATGPAGTQPAKAQPAKPAPVFLIGDKVEAKWGGLWRKGTVKNKRGEWILVNYDGPFLEWVEPWRVRRPGSTEDLLGSCTPNKTMMSKIEDPPTPKPGPAPAPPEAAGSPERAAREAADEAVAPLTPADRSGAQDVVLGGGGIGVAGVTPDPEAKAAKKPAGQTLVLAGGTGDPFDAVVGLHFTSPSTGVAVVVHEHRNPGGSTATRVERVDLFAGRSTGTAQLPKAGLPLDVSGDGKLLATHPRDDHGTGKTARVDVWQVDAAGDAKHVVSFLPFEGKQEGFHQIAWAHFVGPDHLLVAGTWGQLGLWEFRNAKEVWSAAVDTMTEPAVSPGGKYLAAAVKGQAVVAETMTGKALAQYPAGAGASVRHLAFRPDGAALAAAGADGLLVWDLVTGKTAYDLSLVGVTGSGLDWVADRFVLLDHQRLVSLEKQMVVWTYYAAGGIHAADAGAFAGRYWYVTADTPGGAGGRRKPVLVSAALPDAAGRAAAADADTDAQMVIRPGLRVSLDANVPGEARDRIVASLKARLKENGITVADGQPLHLVARIESGETRQIEYHGFGFRAGPGSEKVSVTDVRAVLGFTGSDGKFLWQRTSVVSAPSFLTLKQNQTVQQAIAEAMKPPIGLFENTRIPIYVPKSPTGLGASHLTSTGPRAEP